jgi:hypothetical protein
MPFDGLQMPASVWHAEGGLLQTRVEVATQPPSPSQWSPVVHWLPSVQTLLNASGGYSHWPVLGLQVPSGCWQVAGGVAHHARAEVAAALGALAAHAGVARQALVGRRTTRLPFGVELDDQRAGGAQQGSGRSEVSDALHAVTFYTSWLCRS